jgi:hypothetical protein
LQFRRGRQIFLYWAWAKKLFGKKINDSAKLFPVDFETANFTQQVSSGYFDKVKNFYDHDQLDRVRFCTIYAFE